jgi:hypothetical protein
LNVTFPSPCEKLQQFPLDGIQQPARSGRGPAIIRAYAQGPLGPRKKDTESTEKGLD